MANSILRVAILSVAAAALLLHVRAQWGAGFCGTPGRSHRGQIYQQPGQGQLVRRISERGANVKTTDDKRRRADVKTADRSPVLSQKVLSLLLDGKPAGLVDWYSSVNDTRKAFVQARRALSEIPLAEAHDLLLGHLEALCKEAPAEPKLVGLVASLCPEASRDKATRRRSIEVALDLSGRSSSAALTLLAQFGVREADATKAQFHGLQDFGDMLSEQQNWEHLVRYQMMFPRIAASAGLTANATIDALAKANQFHLALKLADGFKMGERSRGLRHEMREKKIREAVKSGHPIKGIHACGRSPKFQRLFLNLLLQEGMTGLATHYSQIWGMKLKLRKVHWRLERMRRNNHFQMPRSVPVKFLSSSEALPDAFQKLTKSRVVGLDTESHHRGGLTLLQLATNSHVFLVDLVALSGCAVLGGFLAKLFKDKKITKLSFGGTQDVQMVVRLPCMSGSDVPVHAHVDIQNLAAQVRAREQNISIKKALHGLGLAKLSDALLGKPMNKEMTASDWAARPLSQAQTEYAALDAWILVRLFRKLTVSEADSDAEQESVTARA